MARMKKERQRNSNWQSSPLAMAQCYYVAQV